MEKTPDCLPYSPNIPTPFGYRPSLVAGIIFMILFLGVTIVHVWQAFRHRNIWLGLAFSLGAFGEFVGWLGRTVAYRCPYSVKLLEMQLAALIMAGIYGVLSLMIPIIGQDKSPLRPNLYLIIFMTVDFFSLLLQAVGGGIAGAAFSQNTSPWPGTYTMVAGIIWQLVSTCVFATLLEPDCAESSPAADLAVVDDCCYVYGGAGRVCDYSRCGIDVHCEFGALCLEPSGFDPGCEGECERDASRSGIET
ncbi:putative RTA1 domain protein [Aspergillus novofumigatus IBT 16806]|uniref:Putative RTA1 domain protein n=1 Tax=Aspergillus novofumigatus (strain IBT 16806) TaxID=1392255 RepID=A0A2I1CIS9_ASPN1|nr:putative RTA1 domain protein [Aspergillus novofumigatus IBT 16806]PKX97538.1 putative RTA1 domain protein [Aspergillus novofumigatus IBT 16806]